MKLLHYCYIITNVKNNKVYIGQTSDPSSRWLKHKYDAKNNNKKLLITRAITKYGVDNFNFEIIACCSNQYNADQTEAQLIIQYDSRNPNKGYNVAAGGNTAPRTPEILHKISQGLLKYYKNNNSWNKGGSLTEEWKNKISKSHIGLPGTNAGKVFDKKWKVNISKAHSGKPQFHRRRFSKQKEKKICRLYVQEKKSMYALGQEFDCQRSLIKDILRRNLIEIRKSNYNKHSNRKNIFSLEQEKNICNLYLNGNISRRELAKKFKCGKTTIRDILIRNNIKL